MSKGPNVAGGIGAVFAGIILVVIYPFVWLYEQVGGKLFFAIVIGIPAAIFAYKNWKKTQKESIPAESAAEQSARKASEAEEFHAQNLRIIQERERQAQREYFLKKHHEKEQRKASGNAAVRRNKDVGITYATGRSYSDQHHDLCADIETAWARGDYDWARQQLQKIAYGMVGDSVTDAQRKSFTRLMTDFAREDPLYQEVMARVIPLVQANPGMLQSQIYKGQPDHIKEQMRYVLYFANELGHIKRIKKGNSYKLLPP
ncbi:hypothetical protein [Candidatus Ferrigenium straubiae]|jgi:hypothetical protein|uniref:hypothetical protein n=1 Tax=Candidatus Ferrigenium straubiae TaxID=2919506 RepID=UPI003F4A9456